MSDRYSWNGDRLDFATYKSLTKIQSPLLGSTKNSQDPQAIQLYQNARHDTIVTATAVKNKIGDITEEAKRICGIAKCDPNDKSRCMAIVCQKDQWLDQINKFKQHAETGMWRGVANDKEKIYSPITVNELVELTILMRRNAEQWQGMIEDALKKLDKSYFQKFKRQFKNVRAGDEHTFVTALTIVLVILFLLALLHLVNQIWNSQHFINQDNDQGHHYDSLWF